MRCEGCVVFVVDFEVLRLRTLMPTILAPMRWATSISSGCGFDEGVHAERFGEFEELAQGLLVEGCDDEQDQVGAVCACFPDLVFVDG